MVERVPIGSIILLVLLLTLLCYFVSGRSVLLPAVEGSLVGVDLRKGFGSMVA